MSITKEKQKQSIGELVDATGSFFVKILGTILSYFGVPGVILACVFGFIQKNATSKQKEDIIDTYILLKNDSINFVVLFIIIVFFIAVIVIQRSYWKKKEKMYLEEIDKCADRKSKLQSKLSKSKLATSKKGKS